MEGDRGAGDREKREREVYERRVNRGREVYERRVKRGREVYERPVNRGGKWDTQGGRKREKKEKKIAQHFAMFRNRKNSKRREPRNTGRELGLKSTGGGRLKPPCPLPGEMHACSLPSYCFLRQKTLKLYSTSVGCNSLFCFTLGF